MTDFPSGLLDAIAAGDAVLWTGSGIGALVDAPGWPDLLGAMVESADADARVELEDLLEQGRLRPVFNFFARRDGDARLAELVKASGGAASERELPAGAGAVARMPWRACLASTYSQALVAAFAKGGKPIELLRHLEVHELTLRDARESFVLSSPLTFQGMRSDQTFFDLIEEIVATRTLLLVGFDIDDPDFQQVLGLLERVAGKRQHYAWMPFISGPEAKEFEAVHRLKIVHAKQELDFNTAFATLADAVDAKGKKGDSRIEQDGAALDLARTLRRIPTRADFALDVSLNLDPIELRELVDQAKTAGDALSPHVALSLGAALVAHQEFDRARRLLNRVIARDPGPELTALARFNLALLAAAEGDGETAVMSLNAAAERHRALALVPPRFSLQAVLGHRGGRWDLACEDRGSRQSVHLELSTVDHMVGPDSHARFMQGLKKLVGFDHPHHRRVLGGFADGQVFGLICEPLEGRSLSDLLSGRGRISLENAFRVLGPVMDVLARGHEAGLVHGMLHPDDVWITADGPRLRGWGLAPAVHYRRPSVQMAQRGYAAPELFRGEAPSQQSDLYAVGAMLYRTLTGVLGEGGVVAPGVLEPGLDPRLDPVVLSCMHPEAKKRPSFIQLREEFANMRATPPPARDNERVGVPGEVGPSHSEEIALAGKVPAPPMPGFAFGEGDDDEHERPETLRTPGMPQDDPRGSDPAAPAPVAADASGPSAVAPDSLAADPRAADAQGPSSVAPESRAAVPEEIGLEDSGLVRLKLPEHDDDLEGWTFVLEQKPEHMEARQHVERIETEAREAGRWDRVADVLRVRAELSQAQDERVAILRELADILESKLGAPAFALETLSSVLGEVSLKAKVELTDDLLRLAEVTGKWSEVATLLSPVAETAPSMEDRGRLQAALARIYAEELGAVDRAHGAYVRALEAAPQDANLHEEAAAFYRRNRMPIELAPVVLGLAELETGAQRHELLLEAARLLDEELEEPEAAFETAESVYGEDPHNEAAAELLEGLARRLERFEDLVGLLDARAQSSHDDEQALAALRESATVREEALEDRVGALEKIEAVLKREPDDAQANAARLRLIRDAVGADELPSARLVDLLLEQGERAATPGERADALAEAADLAAKGGDAERAAECRERIMSELPANDPRAEAAGQALEAHYIETQDAGALRGLYEAATTSDELSIAARVRAWAGLLKLSTEVEPDPRQARAALEALCELQPDEESWRERLLERYVADGDAEKAAHLVAERAEAAGDDGARAEALVDLAALRITDGDLDDAKAKLQEALEIDPTRPRAWARLSEVLDQRGETLPAAQARIRAATMSSDVELVLAAAFDARDTVGAPDQAQHLLERAVQLAPDHLGATEALLQVHLEAENWTAAGPLAEARVSQLEKQSPGERKDIVEALSQAGRCALALEDNDRAKELLARARGIDGTNLKVARLLADLQCKAGEFSAALNSYQSVAMGSADLPAAEEASLYMAMAACQAGLGQAGKQAVCFQRALELDPSHEGATRGLAEAATEPRDKVDAVLRLEALLARQAQSASGDEAESLLDQRVELLREAAELCAGPLGRVDDGVRHYQKALGLAPQELGLMHGLLDSYTSHERWYEATEVLEELAGLQDDGPSAAKYLYAGAVLIRDNVQKPSEALARMRKVLAADPLHEKAFRYTVEALEGQGDAKELSRALRARLKALPEQATEQRVALFDMLGALYEVDLNDPKTALAAYEQAIGLAGYKDDEAQQGRIRRAYELSLEMGPDESDKAIQMAQLVIERRPMDFDAYHALLRMFVTAGLRDSAVCVARALRFLKQANTQEMELANAGDRGFNPPRGVMTGELWTQGLLHHEHSPWLSEVFALIWAVVSKRTGQTHAHLGIQRDQREALTAQSDGFARIMAHACQTLDVSLPDLFLRPTQPGGAKVGALADDKGVYPTIIAGADVVAKQDERITAFRAGRAVARVTPGNVLASVLPSSMSLRDALYGARLCVQPNAEVPDGSRDAAQGTAALLQSLLPPAHRDHLAKIIDGVFERGSDPHDWLRGVEFTATRAGFIMADSLEMSARVLSLGTGDLAGVPPKDLIKDLVSYSVSGAYLHLRRQLKQNL